MELFTSSQLLKLAGALHQWLVKSITTRTTQKAQTVAILEDVIVAVRATTAYCAQLKEGDKDPRVERKLSMLWTRLSFRLEDIGERKLAKKASIKGRLWADDAQFTAEFLELADISLGSVEDMAVRLRAVAKAG